MKSLDLVVFTIICLLVIIVHSERTKDKMYVTIKGISCFRRLNGTHQTGCSSSRSGNVGVLHLVKTSKDLDFILNEHPSPPYAPIINPEFFTRENILLFKNSKYVSAVVLINNTTNLESFSQESRCPNQFSGLLSGQTCDINNKETAWNPFGNGILLEDLPFPIYFISDKDEIDKVIDCFEKFNSFNINNQNKRSLCGIEVNSFMAAAVNSEVCIRRSSLVNNPFNLGRFCDPLQGKNIYGTLFPRDIVEIENSKVNENEKFILVSCRMDTTSMFDGIAPGAKGSVVSFTTVLSAAHLLSKILPKKTDTNKNVIFMFFSGESYDYIGSQRFVYDLTSGLFPSKNFHTNLINITNIELMIDISTLDDIGNIKAYVASDFEMARNVTELLKKYNNQFNFNSTTSYVISENLPPTSAQSFLRENLTFPVVILTSTPNNHFYHSIYDNLVNINYKYANTSKDFTELDEANNKLIDFKLNSIQISSRNFSSILAFTLYNLITKKDYTETKIASSVLVDEILYCFLESANCPLFKASSHPDSDIPNINAPPNGYVSVQVGQELAAWVYRLSGYLLSQKQPDIPMENCSIAPLYWFAGFNGSNECRLTTHNFSTARSPAFLDEDYDWKSGKYSTWTESTWTSITARIFLIPSRSHEVLTLSIGIVTLVISFLLIFIINSKADILFENGSDVSTTLPARC